MIYIPYSWEKGNIFVIIIKHKTENRNGEYIKETKTRPKGRQQPKVTNGSSTQREYPATGGGSYRVHVYTIFIIQLQLLPLVIFFCTGLYSVD